MTVTKKITTVHPHLDANIYDTKLGDGKGLVLSVNHCEIQDLEYMLMEDDSSEDINKEGKSKVPSYQLEER